jgi:hypothetical protein
MNNEELRLHCLYGCIDDQIYVKLKFSICRVINITQKLILDGFIFLLLATKTRGVESVLSSPKRYLPETHFFGSDRCT